MRARRLRPADLAELTADDLLGAILLAPAQLAHGQIRKGSRLDLAHAQALIEERREVRVAWAEAGDLHEDDAADRLARAAAGNGVMLLAPRQSRLDLVARADGVLHVQVGPLSTLNALDPLEVFTLYHGQAIVAGQVVASVKVAPHVVAESVVREAEAIALRAAPLVDVRPYRALEVAAIVLENLSGEALARFEAGARTKVEALGSQFLETVVLSVADPDAAIRAVRETLQRLALERRLPVILVAGVSAGDPLSPFYAALEELGGRLLRRGVPAHPGSMIWLAEVGGSRLLGLPQCGMFTLATAADLVLARLLTGEALTAESLSDLAHGGLLVQEMRFRFPAYARGLRAPEG
jgi:hypothetical protein